MPLRKTMLTLALAACLVPAQALLAQGATEFEKLEHDFGAITEGDKPSYTFTYTNTGDAPVRLLVVRPSCGCTTPEWTREPVAPGGSGKITVAYNSEERPGSFRREIAVFTDGQPEETVLHIKGYVKPKPLTSGVAQGNLLFEHDSADLGALAAGESGLFAFRVQNNGSRPVAITGIQADPKLSVSYPSEPLPPGEMAVISVVLEGQGGAGTTFTYPIVLKTDDDSVPVKTVHVSGRGE